MSSKTFKGVFMSIHLRVFGVLFLSAFISQAYAITVSVHSNKKVEGIGFTANGSKHGGMGSEYHASRMPKGMYTFGVRVHGKDIPCRDASGKKSMKLSKNTKAILTLSGKACTFKLNSK
jgi:hypothetical protein